MTYFSSQTPPEQTFVFAPQQENEPMETVLEKQNPASLDVRYEVAFQISHEVPEVQAIFTQLEGRILRVWTVVPDREEAVYKNLYVQERRLLDLLDGIEFEFNIIPNMGREPRDVVTDPSGALVFLR